MSVVPHTHYKNLSISENATPAQIDAAYEALMAKYSLPEYANDNEAARVREVLTISHERLSSQESRRLHDEWVALTRRKLNTDGSARQIVTAAPTGGWNATSNTRSAPERQATGSSWSIGTVVPLAGLVFTVLIFGWISKRADKTNASTTPPMQSTPPSASSQSASSAPPKSSTGNFATIATPANSPTATPLAPTAPPTLSLEFRPDLAIAAVTANVRSGPSAKSSVVRTIERAAPLQKLGVDGTFTQVRLADGMLGWVAQDLLIPHDDARRLNTLTASQYLSDRAPEKRLTTFDAAIMSGDAARQINATFASFSSPTLDMTATLTQLKELAQTRVIAPASDDAAALWYTLAATAARNSGNLDEALSNYLAAAEASPATGAHHSAVALAAYELGKRDLLLKHAYIALAVSPETTNSCLVFSLALASLSSAEQPREVAAANTLRLAIHYSRDAAFTVRYLRGLATKTTNPIVARAIATALTN